jgi:pimeloyl-ACP methyl ester carboxylesterase
MTRRSKLSSSLTNLAVAAVCVSTLLAQPAHAADKIGIVLMHGEQGAPGRVIDGLSARLDKAGYLVSRPDMCWSARRSYEQEFEACLAVVDETIVKLRNMGATGIVVGGFSLGGTAAIAYGATHSGLLGVFALAPSHDGPALSKAPAVKESLAKAKALIDQGKGDTETSFADVAIGPSGAYTTEIATTASIYLSFFGEASAANLSKGVAQLRAPLLWVSSRDDQTQVGDGDFAKAPKNPLNRHVEIAGTHLATPNAASDAVLGWLAQLAKE